MNVQLKKPEMLTPAEHERWRQIVDCEPAFDSPYFHPEFTQAVSDCRDDVEVAVISDGREPVGFFPFQRCGQQARPVGGQLSDAHGIIHDGSLQLEDGQLRQLLRQCGLTAWHYHYQIESQIPAAHWQPQRDVAAVMNLTGGFAAYADRLPSKNVIRQTERKARKLAREHGAVDFLWHSLQEEHLQQLMDWKSAQYAQSEIADVFAFDWTRQLLRHLWQRTGNELQGLLSVMTVADRPVALHLGLRAGAVLHQWFPAYDPALRDYSPGMIHLLEMARQSATHGVTRIDLGRMCHYKSRLATDTVDVAAGNIDLQPVRRLLRHGYQQTFAWLRHSPLRSVTRVPGRMLRRLAERREFQ